MRSAAKVEAGGDGRIGSGGGYINMDRPSANNTNGRRTQPSHTL